MADELKFGPDLSTVRRQLESLTYFNSVTDLQAATVEVEQMTAVPPAAYVSVASEVAEPNRMATGPISQRVSVSISTLFCVPAEKASGDAGDDVDDARKAIIRILVGFTPGGCELPLEYDRFQLRGVIDGLIWAEVLTKTVYRYTQA